MIEISLTKHWCVKIQERGEGWLVVLAIRVLDVVIVLFQVKLQKLRVTRDGEVGPGTLAVTNRKRCS